jgi:hypothetical protein
VDTNVLVYAHRAGFKLHRRAHDRLAELVEGDVPWGLPVFCIGEFCRVVTHPRILSPPTEPHVALDALDAILGSPSVRLLSPGPAYPSLFRRVTEEAGARGNLVFDAQIAAVCLEHGATRLLTADRDFHRFRGIQPSDP